jgi:uncharacterized membrane protein required for colicin V production
VDLVETNRSAQLFDLLVILFLFACFILGFVQGTIRRLLGLASLVFSFFLGMYGREPVGDYLAGYWTSVPPEYSAMIAFLIVFLVSWIGLTLVIQTYYHKTTLFERSTIIDEILGGILGVLSGLVLIGIGIVILDSYFTLAVAGDAGEFGLLRTVFEIYDPTATARIYREDILPMVFGILGPLVPSEIAALFAAPST